jgi:hypothetical protein
MIFPTNEELGGVYESPEMHLVGELNTNVKGDLRSMTLVPGETYQGNRCLGILGEAWGLFVEKNNIYGEPDDDDLGAQGQFADMHRKWKRIRKHLWEGQEWPADGESFEQVMMEFIGHVLLTIDFMREKK